MLQSVLENILAGIACTLLCALAKRIYLFFKAPSPDHTQHRASKKLVHRQFFISLFTMAFSFTFAFAIPNATPFNLAGVLRVSLLLCGGFGFIMAWGAFDAAFAFYPSDDPPRNSEAESPTDEARE